jgi:hypothetical protein
MRATAVTRIILAALVGLALIVGGCGGTGSGGGSAGVGEATPVAGTVTETPASEPTEDAGGGTTDEGDLDVCSMVSAADVEAILGEAAEAGIDNSSVDLRVCSWTGTATPTRALTVSIYVHPDATTAREQYLATTEGLGGVEILNLADEATYADDFGLRVLAGRYDIGIDSTSDDEKASSLKLAQQILPLLP